jgi:hypothetical protein
MSDGDPGALRVEWKSGGSAWVVSLRRDAVVLRSTVPSPPGSRIEGAIECGKAFGPLATLRIKVHSAKLQTNGNYLLAGRALDMTRELRERIEGGLSGGGKSGSGREGAP